MRGEIIIKFLFFLLITNISIGQISNKKLVYVIGNQVEIDSVNCKTNIFISDKIVRDKEIKTSIGLFIAYNIEKDRIDSYEDKLELNLLKCSGLNTNQFIKKYKKDIVKVIYYLERFDHGDLVEFYGRDAYNLLDLDLLNPEILIVKNKLLRKGMTLIDAKANRKEDSIIRVD